MKIKMILRSLVFIPMILLGAHACQPGPPSSETYSADIIIYGGTAAGVIAAVQAVHMGRSVLVVSPDRHLGGLSAGGLGWTDSGDKAVVGGLAREFYRRVYQHYNRQEAWHWQSRSEYGNLGQSGKSMDDEDTTMWIFEPHVAETIFEDLVRESGITVFRDEWLDRDKGMIMKGPSIHSMKTLSRKVFIGKLFIDATYEGDLMAAAGVSYRVGREANSVYGEQWNGIQTGVLHHAHYFEKDVSPYVDPGDPLSGVLPGISTENPGEYGSGDHRVQAYCFRMCLTKVPENRVEITPPEGYDPYRYELLVRLFDSGWRGFFNKYDPIPNAKTDVNNHGAFSTDNIGMNYDYPEASYERRQEIIREHETYQKGLLYFVQTDPRVPAGIQEEMKQWGYARDEFRDNGHWPHQIYVREARRMIGQFVMTENEVLDKSPVHHSIGMGSYTMDSHNVQRYIKPDGFVQNEGDIGVHPPRPYRIDLGSILPLAGECDNLLVPVCVSASHIAFGSIRMEPVFMILGQGAATVAGLAIEKGQPVQDIPYGEIRTQLLEDGQVLEYEP